MTRDAGTLLYMPPEMWKNTDAHYGTSADVYSYGLLLVELWTGKWPFHPAEYGWIIEFLERVRRGEVLPAVAAMAQHECPESLVELTQRCVSLDPEARPSFRDVVRKVVFVIASGEK